MSKSTITVKVTGDAKGLQVAFRDAESAATRFARQAEQVGGRMQSWGKDLTRNVTLPIVGLGVASFKSAADLEDSMGAVDQIYRGASQTVKDWADSLPSFYGVAKSEALQYATVMGSMLQNIGQLSEEESARTSASLIELAGDLTAMYGGSVPDAVRALTGALKGNNTMLDNYGISALDAEVKARALEMGIWDGTGALNAQEKQAATLSIIMDQTAAAQGQAAREADGASGTWRAFTTDLKNFAAEIGTHVLPIGNQLLTWGSETIAVFSGLPGPVQGGIVVVAALAAAIGPLLFVGGKLISWAGQMVGAARAVSSAMVTMRLRAMYASQALGPAGIAGAAGAALIGVGLLTAAYMEHRQRAEESRQRTKAFADAIRDAGDAAEGTTAAIRAMDSPQVARFLRDMGASVDDMGAALNGTEEEWATFRDSMVESSGQSGLAADMLRGHLNQVRSEVQQATADAEVLDEVMGDAAEEVEGLGTAYNQLSTFVDDASAAMNEWERQVRGAVDAAFRSDNAIMRWEAAIDDLTDAVTENGSSLDEGTAAGRRNRQALQDLVRAGNDRLASLAAEGKSSEELAAARDLLVAGLVAEVDQLGINRDEAALYIDTLNDVPTTVPTRATWDSIGADWGVAAYKNALASIPRHVTTKALLEWGSSVGATVAKLAGRAAGGPVTADTPYIVGEKGIEVFVPRVSGTIIPNHDLTATGGRTALATGAAGGGGDTYIVNAARMTAEEIEEMLYRLSRRKGRLAFKATA